jgi:hypothetical protein
MKREHSGRPMEMEAISRSWREHGCLRALGSSNVGSLTVNADPVRSQKYPGGSTQYAILPYCICPRDLGAHSLNTQPLLLGHGNQLVRSLCCERQRPWSKHKARQAAKAPRSSSLATPGSDRQVGECLVCVDPLCSPAATFIHIECASPL